MTTFKPWTPPPGAVVEPPVHRESRVICMWSDGVPDDGDRAAGSINWSSVGDGPCVVAYAIVEEYKPAPELREWWFSFGDDDFDDDIVVLHENYSAADDGSRDGYGRICNRREIIHVREVPDPSREVVAWAVVNAGGGIVSGLQLDEASARRFHHRWGGTVVKLTGVMPDA